MGETVRTYHGSKRGLEGAIRADRGNPVADFGAGFYMDTDAHQPQTLICGGASPVLYTLDLDTLGLKGPVGALGDLDPVAYLTSEAGLVYAGAGETTDRTIALSNATVLADGTFNGENAPLGLAKKGSGTWRLSAANTYQGSDVGHRGGYGYYELDNFPASLTVDVSGRDPEAKAVRFARVTEGELATSPTVTIVGGQPDQDWHVMSAGGVFRVGVREGTLLIVK